jgi:hypothetical protein
MGRLYAWLSAEGFLVGSVLLLLLGLNVGVSAPGTLGYYRTSTWLVVGGSLFLLVGMLALIAVGLALRELFGRGARAELMAVAFLAGGLLGASSRLLVIPARLSAAGVADLAGNGRGAIRPEALNSFLLTYSMVENTTNWLLYGWFLLTGLALYHAGRLAAEHGLLPRAWSRLGLASAVGCGIVVLATLSTLLPNVPGASLVGRLSMVAVGVVLIPAWSIWLGRELGAALKRERAAADGVTEGPGPRRPGPAVRLPRVPIGAPGRLLRLLARAPLALRPQPGRQTR